MKSNPPLLNLASKISSMKVDEYHQCRALYIINFAEIAYHQNEVLHIIIAKVIQPTVDEMHLR